MNKQGWLHGAVIMCCPGEAGSSMATVVHGNCGFDCWPSWPETHWACTCEHLRLCTCELEEWDYRDWTLQRVLLSLSLTCTCSTMDNNNKRWVNNRMRLDFLPVWQSKHKLTNMVLHAFRRIISNNCKQGGEIKREVRFLELNWWDAYPSRLW